MAIKVQLQSMLVPGLYASLNHGSDLLVLLRRYWQLGTLGRDGAIVVYYLPLAHLCRLHLQPPQ